MSPVPVPGPGGALSGAGIYDALLGGEDHLPGDEIVARRIQEVCPAAPAAARRNREFLDRAVMWAAAQGIGQFADLGSGYPLSPSTGLVNIHESARAVNPGATAVYADISRDVISHCDALLAGPGVTAVRADLRDPLGLLSRRAVRAVTDPGRPMCLVLGLVLGLMTARQAREVVAGYALRAAAGSIIVISGARADDDGKAADVARVLGIPVWNHGREEMLGFLDGLELVEPGLVVAREWRGGMPRTGLPPDAPGYVMGAVARVP